MGAEIRSDTAHPYATLRNRLRPVEPAGGDRQPGLRVHLHHIRRGAAGVSGTGQTLDRAVWWDAHLHRSAGGTLRKGGQQRPDRLPEDRPFGDAPLVEGRQRRRHCGGLNVRRGHDGTIRPQPIKSDAGPGSRRDSRTRHSCRRRIRTVMIPRPGTRRSGKSVRKAVDVSTHRRAWKQRAGVVVALVTGALIALPATPALAAKITSSGDSVTIDAGRSGSVRVEVSPDGNEESAQISVNGLPQGVSCTGGCGTIEFEGGLGGPRPATVTLTLSASGNAPAANNAQATIRVEGNSSDSRNLRVTVKAAAPPAVQTVRSVSGKVVIQANGKPVKGAYVALQDSGGHRYETTSDSDGNWRFTGTSSKPITPGRIDVGASFDGVQKVNSFNAGPNQSISGQRINLAVKVEVTPSATPSASESAVPTEEPTDEATDEATDETPEATEGAAANASNEDSGGGFGQYVIILLGGLLVAAGVGTIVLLWMKRKENPDDADDDAPAGAGAVPAARGGGFRSADDQTRVVNRVGGGPDPTMVAGGGAALSEAPTMMHRPVVDDVPPDPYGAPPSQAYGDGGPGWSGNGYGDEPAGYGAGGYGNAPASGGGYGADGGYGSTPGSGAGYGNAPGSGGGYGAGAGDAGYGDGGYGNAPSSGEGYGSRDYAAPAGGAGYPPASGNAGYGEQRYDEPTGRYTGDNNTQYPAPADPYATGVYEQGQGQGYGQPDAAPYGQGAESTAGYDQRGGYNQQGGGYDQPAGGYGQQGGYGQEPPTQRGGYDDPGYDQGGYGQPGYGQQGGYGQEPATTHGGYGQEPPTQRGGYEQEPQTQRGYDDRGYDQGGYYGDQQQGGRSREGDRSGRRLDWLDD
ncbi:carboxypeptidase regulatory-like domain-containing protein [Micromonospora musae]|uniref:Carboxypeptidase regulatory-like domain-containing protein n=2 Tax=Micromonospora musae TaxID=1894970 RepID=A0ABX9RN17_9ACTN|nr:carboxypeptidase regulatory-like domain-containing protein [Micromonospora musae]